MSKLNCRVEDGYYPGILDITGYDFRIAVVTSATDLSFQDGIKRKDQAHLIAAAPDLYESATAALNLLDRSLDSEPSNKDIMAVLEKLSAALAKARGEL